MAWCALTINARFAAVTAGGPVCTLAPLHIGSRRSRPTRRSTRGPRRRPARGPARAGGGDAAVSRPRSMTTAALLGSLACPSVQAEEPRPGRSKYVTRSRPTATWCCRCPARGAWRSSRSRRLPRTRRLPTRDPARRHRQRHRLCRLDPARAHPGLAGRARRRPPVLHRQVRGDGRPVRRGHERQLPRSQTWAAAAGGRDVLVRCGGLSTRRLTDGAGRTTPSGLPHIQGVAAYLSLPTEIESEYAARGGLRCGGGPVRERIFPTEARSATMPGTRAESAGGAQPHRPAQAQPARARRHVCGNVEEFVLEPFYMEPVGRRHGQPGGFVAKGGSFQDPGERLRTAMRREYDNSTSRPARRWRSTASASAWCSRRRSTSTSRRRRGCATSGGRARSKGRSRDDPIGAVKGAGRRGDRPRPEGKGRVRSRSCSAPIVASATTSRTGRYARPF